MTFFLIIKFLFFDINKFFCPGPFIKVNLNLSKLGIASYAGYYKDLNYKKINFNLDIKNFSKHCLKIIDTKGLDRILKIIKDDTK